MKPFGIIVFPGTQCEQDTVKALHSIGIQSRLIWYKNRFDIEEFDSYIVPGGFSYGDYLRSGALASKSPAVMSLIEAARKGMPILGICNGFQILCEAGLLPGTLLKNENLLFKDIWVDLELQNSSPHWAKDRIKNPRLPIAHSEGRYFVTSDMLKELQQNQQIWMTYKENPNGSVGHIAGVMNKNKNIAALMPHPERATELWMGSTDGCYFF